MPVGNQPQRKVANMRSGSSLKCWCWRVTKYVSFFGFSRGSAGTTTFTPSMTTPAPPPPQANKLKPLDSTALVHGHDIPTFISNLHFYESFNFFIDWLRLYHFSMVIYGIESIKFGNLIVNCLYLFLYDMCVYQLCI
jgi:hypothetical protein